LNKDIAAGFSSRVLNFEIFTFFFAGIPADKKCGFVEIGAVFAGAFLRPQSARRNILPAGGFLRRCCSLIRL